MFCFPLWSIRNGFFIGQKLACLIVNKNKLKILLKIYTRYKKK
jgi:hypothetical protein